MAIFFGNHSNGFLVMLMLVGVCSARQIRVNRYSTRIEEDTNNSPASAEASDSVNVRSAPYPPAGFRPGRAFNLPTEEVNAVAPNAADKYATSTQLPDFDVVATTTETFSAETTTGVFPTDTIAVDAEEAPYPPAGYRPSKAFNLPTENQLSSQDIDVDEDADAETIEDESNSTELEGLVISTTTTDSLDDANTESATEELSTEQPGARVAPYPQAGYRPARAFDLPTETEPAASTSDELHPACGVRDDKMTDVNGDNSKDDPDSERVLVTAAATPNAIGPEMIPLQVRPLLQLRSQPLIAQPIILGNRPFAYSAQYQTW